MVDLAIMLEVLSPSKQLLGWPLSCKLPLLVSPNLCSFFKIKFIFLPKLQQYDEDIAAIIWYFCKKRFDDRNGALGIEKRSGIYKRFF